MLSAQNYLYMKIYVLVTNKKKKICLNKKCTQFTFILLTKSIRLKNEI